MQLDKGTVEVQDQGDRAQFINTISNKANLSGQLTKTGKGTLELWDNNSYSGGTIIVEGMALLLGEKLESLGSGKVTIQEKGVLSIALHNKKIGALEGNGIVNLLTANKSLEVSKGGHFEGQIIGEGDLFVTDQPLTLSGKNRFTGGIRIQGEKGALNFEKEENLGGLGRLRTIEIVDEGTLRAIAASTLSRDKIIKVGDRDQAMRSGAIAALDHVDLTLEGRLEVAQNRALHKKEKGNFILEGDGTNCLGLFAIDQGRVTIGPNSVLGRQKQAGDDYVSIKKSGALNVEGRCPKWVNVYPEGILEGNGICQVVNNGGIVRPGVTRLTIQRYNQANARASSPPGILEIEVNDLGRSNHLKVSGLSTLKEGSQLVFAPLPGIYDAGISYDFFTAEGGFTQGEDKFSTVRFGDQAFSPQSVRVKEGGKEFFFTLPTPQFALPKSAYNLKGNGKKISDYLFQDINLFSNSLKSILRKAFSTEKEQPYSEWILQLGPEQFGSLSLMTFQSGIRMGKEMSSTDLIERRQTGNKQKHPDLERFTWIAPIGYYYKQEGKKDRASLRSRAYGLVLGHRRSLSNHLFLGGGLGYTYSDFDWEKQQGKGVIQSIYLAPSLTYMREDRLIGGMVAGGMSFYDVHRNILLLNREKSAKSYHHSFDLLLALHGALKWAMTTTAFENLFCMPMFRCSFFTAFENGFRESKADPLNLFVLSKFSAFVRPEVTLKLFEEVNLAHGRLVPSIYVGWVKNIMLNQSKERAKLDIDSFSKTRSMTLESTYPLKHQCVLGAEISMEYPNRLSLTISYEANLVGSTHVQEGKLNITWSF